MQVPESLKIITPFIKRAEELERDTSPNANDSKIVAYYCKKYALEKAIGMKSTAPDANPFIMSVLTSLEQDKKKFNVAADTGSMICENFAFTVFSRADEEDRAGLASKVYMACIYKSVMIYSHHL